jgi:chaperonin GroES
MYDRVLVKVTPILKQSPGGIILQREDRKDHREGEVVAVGIGYKTMEGTLSPLQLKVGDKVIFCGINGVEYKPDGHKDGEPYHLILKENEIWGILP